MYHLLQSDIKSKSFNNLELLKAVIEFKKKFYTSNWAKYDNILLGDLKLVPSDEAVAIFSKDYDNMQDMIMGVITPFDEIIKSLKEYEIEFNKMIKNQI